MAEIGDKVRKRERERKKLFCLTTELAHATNIWSLSWRANNRIEIINMFLQQQQQQKCKERKAFWLFSFLVLFVCLFVYFFVKVIYINIYMYCIYRYFSLNFYFVLIDYSSSLIKIKWLCFAMSCLRVQTSDFLLLHLYRYRLCAAGVISPRCYLPNEYLYLYNI